MVNKDVVMATVKKMYDSGIDDATVKSTLKDIGLSDEEMQGIMAEAKGGAPLAEAPPAPEAAAPAPESAAEAPQTPEIKQDIASMKEDHDLAHTTAQAQMDEHTQTLGEVHQKVDDLSQRIDVTPASGDVLQRLEAMDNKINTIESQLAEIKGATDALQSLLKKILETNRKVLLKKK